MNRMQIEANLEDLTSLLRCAYDRAVQIENLASLEMGSTYTTIESAMAEVSRLRSVFGHPEPVAGGPV